jgi:DNA polymerase III gamma/tau subunit
LSFSKNKSIDEEEVELITGAPSSDLVNGVIVAMAEGELEKALTRVRTAVEQNIDMKMYMKLILQKFRYALMLRYAPEMKNDIKERIQNVISRFSTILQSRNPRPLRHHHSRHSSMHIKKFATRLFRVCHWSLRLLKSWRMRSRFC